MTILFLSIEFNFCCGISRSIFSLARQLKKNGHRIILGSPSGTMVRDFLSEGMEHIYMPIYPNRKTLNDAWYCFKTINRAVEQYDIDVIHSHHRLAEFYVLFSNIIKRKPTVSTAHAVISGKKNLSFRSNKVLAVSNTITKMLLDDFGVNKDRIHLVRNIPRTLMRPSEEERNAFIDANKVRHSDFVVACIGRLHKEKGFDLFIKALKYVKHLSRIKAVIVGKGVEEQSLKTLATKLGVDVTFIDEINEVELVYSIADIIVVPSRQESAGLVAIEAGFFGKPVIATNVGGLIETIIHDTTGYLVPSENPEAIAKAIEHFYSNPESTKELAENLYTYVTKEYNAERIGCEVELIYTQLLKTCKQ